MLRVSCKVNVKPFGLHLLCKRPKVFMIPMNIPKIELIAYLYIFYKYLKYNFFLNLGIKTDLYLKYNLINGLVRV